MTKELLNKYIGQNGDYSVLLKSEQHTAFMFAAYECDIKNIKKIINLNTNIYLENSDGQTALDYIP